MTIALQVYLEGYDMANTPCDLEGYDIALQVERTKSKFPSSPIKKASIDIRIRRCGRDDVGGTMWDDVGRKTQKKNMDSLDFSEKGFFRFLRAQFAAFQS